MTGLHCVDRVIFSSTGKILPHEHIFCDFTKITGNSDHLLNDLELAKRELVDFTRSGGQVVVDTTPIDLGRDPRKLLALSLSVDVDIIMSTGWYRKAFYPAYIDELATKDLAKILIEDLTIGIDVGNGQRAYAGLIGEIGVDRDAVSALEERVLRASALAHLETGAPISTHSSMYPVGTSQLEILLQEGVNPMSVIIGHADTYLDIDYHIELLDSGVYLQFDTFGRNHMNPHEGRMEALFDLISKGYRDQILISSDRCFRSDLKAFGGLGYEYIVGPLSEEFLDRGLSADDIDALLRINPLRALSW
jgi:phosphotriesterase-related protein